MCVRVCFSVCVYIYTIILDTDVGVHPNCHDLAGRKACYEESHRCEFKQEYIYRYCCKTCTLMGVLPTYGPHLRGDAEGEAALVLEGETCYIEDHVDSFYLKVTTIYLRDDKFHVPITIIMSTVRNAVLEEVIFKIFSMNK